VRAAAGPPTHSPVPDERDAGRCVPVVQQRPGAAPPPQPARDRAERRSARSTGRTGLTPAPPRRAEAALRAALDLVLGGPGAPAGGGEPWHDPLARWALGALLERACAAPAPPPAARAAAAAGPGEADAARWAARFAADSFGDALLAAGLAAVLRPGVAPAAQAALLRGLDAGLALHLLPPLRLAPGGRLAYARAPAADPACPPAEAAPEAAAGAAAAGAAPAPDPALLELARLAGGGRLRRAAEAGSLVADLALARLAPLLAPGTRPGPQTPCAARRCVAQRTPRALLARPARRAGRRLASNARTCTAVNRAAALPLLLSKLGKATCRARFSCGLPGCGPSARGPRRGGGRGRAAGPPRAARLRRRGPGATAGPRARRRWPAQPPGSGPVGCMQSSVEGSLGPLCLLLSGPGPLLLLPGAPAPCEPIAM